jgi:hypothetical protein
MQAQTVGGKGTSRIPWRVLLLATVLVAALSIGISAATRKGAVPSTQPTTITTVHAGTGTDATGPVATIPTDEATAGALAGSGQGDERTTQTIFGKRLP